jgi:hypothetical protein
MDHSGPTKAERAFRKWHADQGHLPRNASHDTSAEAAGLSNENIARRTATGHLVRHPIELQESRVDPLELQVRADIRRMTWSFRTRNLALAEIHYRQAIVENWKDVSLEKLEKFKELRKRINAMRSADDEREERFDANASDETRVLSIGGRRKLRSVARVHRDDTLVSNEADTPVAGRLDSQ